MRESFFRNFDGTQSKVALYCPRLGYGCPKRERYSAETRNALTISGSFTAEIDFRTLRYGLDGFDVKERQTLIGLLKMPFMSYTRT